MKIIITGASGYLGKYLTKSFYKKGYDLLLVGRSLKKLKSLNSKLECCNYNQLVSKIQKNDILLDLAFEKSPKNYKSLEIIKNLNIKLFKLSKKKTSFYYYFSSSHALDFSIQTDYSKMKREIVTEINKYRYKNSSIVYLPYVYGDNFRGHLKFLNLLPNFFKRNIFLFISSLKPTVNLEKISEKLIISFSKKEKNIYIYDDKDKNIYYKFIKRFVDLFFSLLILSLFWWLFILIIFAVKIETRGPAFFFQERVGKNNAIFKIIKFRTMKQGTIQVASHEVPLNNITTIGKILRKTKLDELPQIFNILKNDMSIVGPRPCLVTQKKLISLRNYNEVISLKPGITGLSQVQKIDMKNPYDLALEDRKYLILRSIINDLKIMLKTFTMLIK